MPAPHRESRTRVLGLQCRLLCEIPAFCVNITPGTPQPLAVSVATSVDHLLHLHDVSQASQLPQLSHHTSAETSTFPTSHGRQRAALLHRKLFPPRQSRGYSPAS